MRFDNHSSHCSFIGTRDLREVIAQDTLELAEIGGSFEEIADRMEQIAQWAADKRIILPDKEFMAYMDPLFKKYENKSLDDRNSNAWKKYSREWALRMAKHPKTHYDENIAVIQITFTRGSQECPFEDCRTSWGEDVELVSLRNGR